MNPTHIHLLLNHVAILGALFAIPVYIAGIIKQNSSVQRVALIGFVIAALAAIPVFATGEPAEEAVEHLPGISESIIEGHEEAAEAAVWLMGLTGIVALAGLLMKTGFFNTAPFRMIVMAFSLFSGGSIAYTGYLGGQIRHTEIAGIAQTQDGAGQETAGEEEHEEGEEEDDDD